MHKKVVIIVYCFIILGVIQLYSQAGKTYV